jgi:hypothetical protein
MRVYCTVNAEIDPQHAILFNQIADDIRKEFTGFVESISAQHPENIAWWVSSPASRNTFASPLFHYCCCLVLFERLLNGQTPVDEVVTDSPAFKKIIEGYVARRGVVCRVILTRKISAGRLLKEVSRPLYVLFGLPLRHLVFFGIAQLIRSHEKDPLSRNLILIDTFVMPGYLEKDRYFPGLVDCLAEEEKRRIWFVLQVYGFRFWEFPRVIKQLRGTRRNFILKDDFLRFSDFLCVWRYARVMRALPIKAAFFNGVDMSLLVLEELRSFRNIGSSYVALLNYYFAQRLREAGAKVQLVIDWFENQSIDKGWNAGFRSFFPDCVTVGYQGFVFSRHFLSLYPTDEERKNAVIPQKIAVMGRELVPAVKEFCSVLHVEVAPAFRFQHLWRQRKFLPAAGRFTVLVALPIIIKDAVRMAQLLASLSAETIEGLEFLVKPHPATTPAQIQSAFGDDWPARFKFVGGDFGDCVEKADLLISTAGTACTESLGKGVPVIVIGNNRGLTHNPIPLTIVSDVWSLCYCREEIEKALRFYRGRDVRAIDEHDAICNRIKEGYFEPVTQEGVKRFLEL